MTKDIFIMILYQNATIVPKISHLILKEKTEVLGSDNDQTIDVVTDKTLVFGGGSSSSSKSTNESFDPNKTTISRPATVRKIQNLIIYKEEN